MGSRSGVQGHGKARLVAAAFIVLLLLVATVSIVCSNSTPPAEAQDVDWLALASSASISISGLSSSIPHGGSDRYTVRVSGHGSLYSYFSVSVVASGALECSSGLNFRLSSSRTHSRTLSAYGCKAGTGTITAYLYFHSPDPKGGTSLADDDDQEVTVVGRPTPTPRPTNTPAPPTPTNTPAPPTPTPTPWPTATPRPTNTPVPTAIPLPRPWVVTGLSVKAAASEYGPNRVQLGWSPVTGARRYIVQQSIDNGAWNVVKEPGRPPDPEARDSAAAGTGGVYYAPCDKPARYRVAAFGDGYLREAVRGPFSVTRSFFLQCSPFVGVTGGSAVTEGTNATFTLSTDIKPASVISVIVSISQIGDFTNATTTRSIPLSTTGTARFTVATIDDSTDEADGFVRAAIQSGKGYNILNVRRTASVQVKDNDLPPTPTATATPTASPTPTVTATPTATTSPTPSPTPSARDAPMFMAKFIPSQTWHVRIPVSFQLPKATGGRGELTYNVSPALPKGLTFDSAARTISGTPTDVALWRIYTYEAVDSNGKTAQLRFTLTVISVHLTVEGNSIEDWHAAVLHHDTVRIRPIYLRDNGLRYRVAVPPETGFQIGARQCSWDSPSSATQWSPWLKPAQVFEIVRCSLGTGRATMQVWVRTASGEPAIKLHETEPLRQAWHRDDHTVNYFVSGSRSGSTMLTGVNDGAHPGLFPSDRGILPADYMPSPLLTSLENYVNAANAWNDVEAGVTLRRTEGALSYDVIIRGYWDNDPGGSTYALKVGETIQYLAREETPFSDPKCSQSVACTHGAGTYPHIGNQQDFWIEDPPHWGGDNRPMRWTTKFHLAIALSGFYLYLPAVLMHEFGHTAGLGHAHGGQDIMSGYPRELEPCTVAGLYNDRCGLFTNDKNGLRAIYEDHTSHE